MSVSFEGVVYNSMHRKPTIFFKELYKLGPRGNRHNLKLKEAPEPPNSYGQGAGWKSYLTLIVGHFLWKRIDHSEDRGRSPRMGGGAGGRSRSHGIHSQGAELPSSKNVPAHWSQKMATWAHLDLRIATGCGLLGDTSLLLF